MHDISITKREREIIDLIGMHGMSNKQIARHLKIDPETVKSHLRSIFIKMNIKSRACLFRVIQNDYKPLNSEKTIMYLRKLTASQANTDVEIAVKNFSYKIINMLESGRSQGAQNER